MHSWVIPCLPLRKDAEGVCQRVLSEILWSHGRDVIPLEMSLWLGVASHPRASEIPKGEPKLALSEVKKNSTQMEFQAVSQLHCFRAKQEKNAYFNTKVWYPGSNIGCFPAVSTNFLYRLMLNG